MSEVNGFQARVAEVNTEMTRLRLAVEFANGYASQLARMLCIARSQLGDQASDELKEWYADNAR